MFTRDFIFIIYLYSSCFPSNSEIKETFVYIKRVVYQHHEKGLAYTGTTYTRKLFANISKINIEL